MLQDWLNAADRLNVHEPRGLVLSTVDISGKPSSRVVLLKECNEEGIIFATSQESPKGQNLAANPWAAGTLWWRETIQQVNFQGQVIQLSNEKSDELFMERPRSAQAVAVVSKQSKPLTHENEMKNKVLTLINTNGKIERPRGWHAYHLIVESIEFWHGSQDRFHKRLHYNLVNASWHHQKLQP